MTNVQDVSVIFNLTHSPCYVSTVQRSLSGNACNIFGTRELKNNTCQCKLGYTGDHCEECTIYGINHVDWITGGVNNVTGEGVICSCKFMVQLAGLAQLFPKYHAKERCSTLCWTI